MDLLGRIILSAIAAVPLFLLSGLLVAFIQVKAVERGSPLQHGPGAGLAGFVAWLAGGQGYGFLVEYAGVYQVTGIDALVLMLLSGYGLLRQIDGADYPSARVLFLVHESDDEDWTDVWYRHGPNWRDECFDELVQSE